MSALLLAVALAGPVLEREHAPAGGWAAMEGGTRGGAMALPADVVTVNTRAGLLQALSAPSPARIIRIAGVIDMSEGQAFSSTADQAKRSAVNVPGNTTLLGVAEGAGFINASLHVTGTSQVIIRNLVFRNPCDVQPKWDPKDGPTGNWNSQFDAITVNNSHHVWIDQNRFTDAPITDDKLPVENGKARQCHDGALDITQGSDFVSVSNNHFTLHEKNTLVGSSDRATGDKGHLRVTFHGNWYEHVSERAPRVRFGQVHVYNNYYTGDRKHPAYPYGYSIGVAKESAIISHANAFEVQGATTCAHVVKNPGPVAGVFSDTGSSLNGTALAGCPFSGETGWTVPYRFIALPVGSVAAHVRRNAGPQALAHGAGFVEARLVPAAGAPFVLKALGNPDGQWQGASLQLTEGGLQVELLENGKRVKQVRRRGGPPGSAVNLRLAWDAAGLAVHLDGERVTSAAITPIEGQAPAQWDAAGHQLLGIRSGTTQPSPVIARLASPVIRTQAGDPDLAIPFSGTPAVAGSATGIARIAIRGNTVAISPLARGNARISLVDPSDSWNQQDLMLQVGAAFEVPRSSAAAVLSPGRHARGVPVDTTLRITLTGEPKIGEGSLRVYRSKDKSLVAVVRAQEVLAGLRGARQDAVFAVGNTVHVRLPRTLEAGTEYEVLAERTFLGQPIAGWKFRTSPFRPIGDSVTVDDDGRADFRTVQGALDHVMTLPREKPVSIHVRSGIYPELLHLRGKDNVTIRGASPEASVIRAANSDARNPGSDGRALFLAEDCDLLEIRDISLHNTTLRKDGHSAQAETLYFKTDTGRLTVRNARFTSEQDTLQLGGYAWFYQSLVEGNVDFIWGHNRAALFEDSEIRSIGDSAYPDRGGYVVQARTVEAGDPGFVFLRSRFTSGPGPAGNTPPAGGTVFARSPGTRHTFDKVAILHSQIGPHMAKDGWLRDPAPNPRDGWREFGNTSGHGGYQMNAQEAAAFSSRSSVFARRGWNPQP